MFQAFTMLDVLLEIDPFYQSIYLCSMARAKTWQLHEAKARFSELFRRVRTEGPQRVVKHRGEAVVIIRAEEFDHAGDLGGQPKSLLEFFQSAPGGSSLDLKRKRDSTRTIKW